MDYGNIEAHGDFSLLELTIGVFCFALFVSFILTILNCLIYFAKILIIKYESDLKIKEKKRNKYY